MKPLPAFLILAGLLSSPGCGYRFAGQSSSSLPPSIRTIAVLPFENQTLTFKIEQTLTSAVVRELLARSPYRVQSEPQGSDATLHGTVLSIYSSPILFNPESGRTTEVLLTVSLRLRLVSNTSGEVLFEASDWVYREPYQVSQDPATYFGENQPALERLSRQVAGSLVSALMEGFPVSK
ncbi:MAG TPA: LptE family protein [Terriglobia bacterium]|nr:LptE family protein [Terriglobia bacterium]